MSQQRNEIKSCHDLIMIISKSIVLQTPFLKIDKIGLPSISKWDLFQIHEMHYETETGQVDIQ